MNKINTKTRHVLVSLKENIIAGVFQPNSKFPSIRALANNYEVSTQVICSVIFILEKEGWVKKNGRKGVVITHAGNSAGVKMPMSSKIGIIASHGTELGDAFHQRTYSAIIKVEELANANGSTVCIFNTFPESFITDKIVSDIEKEQPDGMIYIPSSQNSRKTLMDAYRLKGLDIPFVIHQRTLCDFDCIDFDNEQMGQDAAAYLFSMGYRKILFLGYNENKFHWMKARIEGFKSFFSSAKTMADWNVLNIPDVKGDPPSYIEIKNYLKTVKLDCTALVCGNDHLAINVMEIFSKMGISVPEDISIIGFDDEMEGIKHGLTTFHLAGELIGEMEFYQIMRLIAKKNVSPVQLKVKSQLMRRNTVAPLKMIQTIHRNVNNNVKLKTGLDCY